MDSVESFHIAENDDLRIMLNEVKVSYEDQRKSVESIKEHASTLFKTSSTLLTLLGAFQILIVEVTEHKFLFYSIIALILFLYITLVVISIYVMFPSKFYGPVDPTIEELETNYFGKNREELLLQQLSNYLNAIKLNKKSVLWRVRLDFLLNGIFFLIVVLIIFAGLLPRFSLIEEVFGVSLSGLSISNLFSR